eukprot:s411_g6.t1
MRGWSQISEKARLCVLDREVGRQTWYVCETLSLPWASRTRLLASEPWRSTRAAWTRPSTPCSPTATTPKGMPHCLRPCSATSDSFSMVQSRCQLERQISDQLPIEHHVTGAAPKPRNDTEQLKALLVESDQSEASAGQGGL